jgi:rhodanese-related sulfurtransferase
MDATTTAQIDRTALVITYCDGVGCNGSTKGALNMVRLGFRVKELIGGIEWWQRDGYETAGSNVTAAFEQRTCGCA